MKGLVLQYNFHKMVLGSSQKFDSLFKFCGLKNGKKLSYKSQNCWIIRKGKTGEKIGISVRVRAASSSSPSMGGSASDYPDSLMGGSVKKKERSIAGINQDNLLDPRHLADPDSCFCEFNGVHIHYKVREPEHEAPDMLQEHDSSQVDNQDKKIGLPIILLHGFGASAFSWDRVMKPFAQITGSKVLAFDRPAFGLTSRVQYSEPHPKANGDTLPLNPYCATFSVLATLFFIQFLASTKTVLIGHSAGALIAVETYFEAPDRVAALILVAPAIMAPLFAPNVANKDQPQKQQRNSSSGQTNLFRRLRQMLSRMYRYIVTAVLQMWRGMLNMVNSLYRKALAAILRSAIGITLVRFIIDKFGIAGVRSAWYDANKVTDYVVQGYTKPLRTKDWDRAIVEYAVSMLTDSQTRLKQPLMERLQEVACPVLIIAGDKDRIVPPWNSGRLSRAIPGSQFEIIKNTGHLPHEEKPEEFVSVVAKFLQRVITGSEELCFQA